MFLGLEFPQKTFDLNKKLHMHFRLRDQRKGIMGSVFDPLMENYIARVYKFARVRGVSYKYQIFGYLGVFVAIWANVNIWVSTQTIWVQKIICKI